MTSKEDPGLWPDCYICRKEQIIETINTALKDNANKFHCIGFIIKDMPDGCVRIYFIVKDREIYMKEENYK